MKNISNIKIGGLRFLPKIHKKTFGIRPIINCINHPTSKISFLIDILLKPIISKIDVILRDSQNLIQKCDFFIPSSNLFLYSCDFESLYTNINPIHASNILSEFMDKYLKNDINISTFAFKTFLNLIFSNNVFKFEDNFFLQKTGLPMGCICGPSVANLFLYIIEKSWLSIHKPLIYARFIDDIFYADTKPLNEEEFCRHFDYLKLNIVKNKTVNFLDLNISFDNITNRIFFDLYIKPTNTFSYLLPSSNHPSFIFQNIPKSLFIRIRRICSSYIDFLAHSRFLSNQLIKRNYDKENIDKTCRLVSKIDRKSLIPYKTKNDENIYKNNLLFFSKYDNSFPSLKNIISYSSQNLFDNCFIKPIYSIKNNIGSVLIHNKKFDLFYSKKCHTSPCKEKNCKTCPLTSTLYYLKLNNFILPIFSNSNCLSTDIIYIIICEKCKLYYIGESSKTARIRLSQHINTIKNFHKNLDVSLSNFDNLSPVACHFAEPGHILENHFRFLIYKKDIVDDTTRKSVECDLINLFINLNEKLINKLIPSYTNIKKLCFD